MSEISEGQPVSQIVERRGVDRHSLTSEEQVQATQNWLKTQKEKPGRTEDEFLEIVARSMVARDLLRSRANEKAKGANVRRREDPLTHLLNRGAYNEDCRTLMQEGAPFGALIVDLDHFKDVNDRFGHPAGDVILFTTALNMASALREARESENEVDKIYRYGGEEFVIIVPGVTSEENLKNVAERIRTTISATPYSLTDNGQARQIPVSVSIGGGIYRQDMENYPEGFPQTSDHPDNPLGYFFNRIDEGLYRAKNDGRDRTVIIS